MKALIPYLYEDTTIAGKVYITTMLPMIGFFFILVYVASGIDYLVDKLKIKIYNNDN